MLAKIMPEPERKLARLARDASADLGAREKRNFGDLGRVGLGRRRELAEIDVDEFVLVHAVVELGPVAREKAERQSLRYAELLVEPPACRGQRVLAWPRMAAARIRPLSAGMVFFVGALLQHETPLLIHQE